MLAAARDTALFDSRADTAYRAFVRASIDDLADHIDRGRQGGWIHPDLPATEVATWLASMVHRTLSATPSLGDDAYMDRLDDYSDIFWNTLYRSVATPGGDAQKTAPAEVTRRGTALAAEFQPAKFNTP